MSLPGADAKLGLRRAFSREHSHGHRSLERLDLRESRGRHHQEDARWLTGYPINFG
jgi:hypothetical protein